MINKQYFSKACTLLLIIILGTSWASIGSAASIPLEIFSLKNYDQNVDQWLKPNDPNYKKSLLDPGYQETRLQDFYNHYFSTDKNSPSPWNQRFVENKSRDKAGSIDSKANNFEKIFEIQKKLLKDFSNDDSSSNIGYGENFRPYNKHWIKKIENNMDMEDLKNNIFKKENKGMITQNAYVRVLPTMEPHFYHFSTAGQGYPFDNLQMTDIWAGTPIYIISETKDKTWVLIMSPDVTGWVQSEHVARVDENFIQIWQKQAKQNLLAVTHTEAPIYYSPNHKPLLRAYVGSVFPGVANVKLTPENMAKKTHYKILFPVKNADGFAYITEGVISKEHATPMPFAATPENFSKILKTLQNRLYGWGGLYFYNDCSQELKSLYAPFGIYLARNSANQAEAGKSIDISSKSMEERLQFLMEQGKPLLTVVYIGRHVFMYLGNYPNPNSKKHELIPMTYQNIWGLKPTNSSHRSIIGQSVLFPLLKQYPEDPKLNSPANTKDFKVIFLDQWPN